MPTPSRISHGALSRLSGIASVFASVFLSIAITVLVHQNARLVDQNVEQDAELACRSALAVETDVLRSEITISLSRGLIAATEGNDEELMVVIQDLRDLQDRLAEAAERRADATEICQR